MGPDGEGCGERRTIDSRKEIAEALVEISAEALRAWIALRFRKRRPSRLELHALRLQLYAAVERGINVAESLAQIQRELAKREVIKP
jgi:hypothetical protein